MTNIFCICSTLTATDTLTWSNQSNLHYLTNDNK